MVTNIQNMIEAKYLKRQGYSQVEISEKLEVDPRTVYNYLNDKVGKGKRGRKGGSKKLERFTEYIDRELEENINLNCELLYEKLIKMGYEGKLTILRKYVREKAHEMSLVAIRRYETLKGEQAQVDWKELGKFQVDGKTFKRYGFIMTLGYSRRSYVEFTTSMEQGVLFACMKRAFEYFGGAPQKILFDNMKTAFLCDQSTRKWYPHPKLVRFAVHYGFSPRRCQVRRPETKGKVERAIRTLEQNFLPRLENIGNKSNTEMNEEVSLWLAHQDEKQLREFGETRRERYEQEKDCLISLPTEHFDHRHEHTVFVNQEGRFAFKGNRYSMPADYLGHRLRMMRDPDQRTLSIYSNEGLLIREIIQHEDKSGMVDDRPEDRQGLMKRWETDRHKVQKRKNRKLKQESSSEVDDLSIYDRIAETAIEPIGENDELCKTGPAKQPA